MKNVIIVGALLCAVFSGLSFAEGGSDRLIDRVNARSQQVQADNAKGTNDNPNTADSEKTTSSKNS